MIRSNLTIRSDPPKSFDFTDQTIEDAIQRMRRMVGESIDLTKNDRVPRQYTIYVGRVPGSSCSSLPRRDSRAKLNIGLDAISLAGIIDLSLRSMHHPSIKKIEFTTNAGNHSVMVTDKLGKKFKITVEAEE